MIATGDIYKILHDWVNANFPEIEVYDGWRKLGNPLSEEVVVILLSTELTPATYWEEAFVYVNVCIPDYVGDENSLRLDEVERLLNERFNKGFSGVYDGSRYKVDKAGISKERDEALKCSYASLRILFKNLNVI